MADTKQVKVEWCENFIRAAFGKHHPFAGQPDAGIEVTLFWKKAQAAGLWAPGVFNGPMTKALQNLTTVESIHDQNGDFIYNVFRLAQ